MAAPIRGTTRKSVDRMSHHELLAYAGRVAIGVVVGLFLLMVLLTVLP